MVVGEFVGVDMVLGCVVLFLVVGVVCSFMDCSGEVFCGCRGLVVLG